jgi:alkanesulfonate monooxygenase SsuD/methylene tetrahydromethanopterin reductase-like flavin-dependent oxidoreductase (luciferase family)
VASEAIALDQLSAGRFILGLGRGATWMGWQAFPDEVTEGRARGEMLDESIDILRGLFARRPFDYPGRHFQVKLSLLDEMYYPPRPLHLPIWVPGAWPRGKSMQRAIKADGLFVEVVNAEGQNGEATPDDVRAICAYVAANRRSQTPFDIVVSGKTGDLEADQQFEKMAAWQAAGATWWVEALFEDDTDRAAERIRQGPPAVSSDG